VKSKKTDGNLLIIDIKINDLKVKLFNIYAPNQDSPRFFDNINKEIDQGDHDYTKVALW